MKLCTCIMHSCRLNLLKVHKFMLCVCHVTHLNFHLFMHSFPSPCSRHVWCELGRILLSKYQKTSSLAFNDQSSVMSRVYWHCMVGRIFWNLGILNLNYALVNWLHELFAWDLFHMTQVHVPLHVACSWSILGNCVIFQNMYNMMCKFSMQLMGGLFPFSHQLDILFKKWSNYCIVWDLSVLEQIT